MFCADCCLTLANPHLGLQGGRQSLQVGSFIVSYPLPCAFTPILAMESIVWIQAMCCSNSLPIFGLTLHADANLWQIDTTGQPGQPGQPKNDSGAKTIELAK